MSADAAARPKAPPVAPGNPPEKRSRTKKPPDPGYNPYDTVTTRVLDLSKVEDKSLEDESPEGTRLEDKSPEDKTPGHKGPRNGSQ